MKLLLDTNILSELARPRPNPAVLDFLSSAHSARVSVMTFHEIAYGLHALADDTQRQRLQQFYADIVDLHLPSACPIDFAIAECAGALRAKEKRAGRVLSIGDSLIAATAIVHRLTLVTRNARDFDGLGLSLVNPFA